MDTIVKPTFLICQHNKHYDTHVECSCSVFISVNKRVYVNTPSGKDLQSTGLL